MECVFRSSCNCGNFAPVHVPCLKSQALSPVAQRRPQQGNLRVQPSSGSILRRVRDKALRPGRRVRGQSARHFVGRRVAGMLLAWGRSRALLDPWVPYFPSKLLGRAGAAGFFRLVHRHHSVASLSRGLTAPWGTKPKERWVGKTTYLPSYPNIQAICLGQYEAGRRFRLRRAGTPRPS